MKRKIKKSYKNTERFSVLDGALAVPCNLKSALAGFNPGGRVWLLFF